MDITHLRRTPEDDLDAAEQALGFESDLEFVAGGSGYDSCNGDSGGPAYISVGSGRKVAGLTSRSTLGATTRCGEGGIYTRVDTQLAFINRVLSDNNVASDTEVPTPEKKKKIPHQQWSPASLFEVSTQGTNRLARGLLAQLGAGRWPNLLLSPCSLAFCLAVVLNGTGGGHSCGHRSRLGLERFAEEEVNRRLQDLRIQVQQVGPTHRCGSGHRGLDSPRHGPQRRVSAPGAAGLCGRSTPPGAVGPAGAATVNRWASDRTSGRITRLVGPDDLTAGTACVLTDVTYFRGPWAVPFDLQQTRTGPFTLPGGQSRNVPMMTQSGPHPYLATDEFQAVALDYAGGQLYMVVLLPSQGADRVPPSGTG